MEEKKSNSGLVCIIILAAIIILGVAGYICFDKFFRKPIEPAKVIDKKDNNKEVLPDNTKTEKEDANRDIAKLIIQNDSLENSIGNNKEILDKATYILADYQNSMIYYFLNQSTKLNDLTNQQKLWILYWYNKVDDHFMDTDVNEILASAQTTYGKTFTVTFEDMGDDIGGKHGYTGAVYKYNSSTNKYDYLGNGGSIGMHFIDKIKPTKFEEKNNKYYITYKMILTNGDMQSSIDAYQNSIKAPSSSDPFGYHYTLEEFNSLESSLPEVTFVFENEDGNLVLTEYIR